MRSAEETSSRDRRKNMFLGWFSLISGSERRIFRFLNSHSDSARRNLPAGRPLGRSVQLSPGSRVAGFSVYSSVSAGRPVGRLVRSSRNAGCSSSTSHLVMRIPTWSASVAVPEMGMASTVSGLAYAHAAKCINHFRVMFVSKVYKKIDRVLVRFGVSPGS